MSGAVNLDECPYPVNKCKCGVCSVCGWNKHYSVHGPIYGKKPGSKPWDHEFVPLIKISSEKPISLHPLSFDSAVKGLMETKPIKRHKKKDVVWCKVCKSLVAAQQGVQPTPRGRGDSARSRVRKNKKVTPAKSG